MTAASPKRERRRLTSGWSVASAGFGPSSFFLTGAFGVPAAAAPAAAGVAGVFGAASGDFDAATSFKAAARAFASAIFAARSRSACEGLFVGSPTSGDLPPGTVADGLAPSTPSACAAAAAASFLAFASAMVFSKRAFFSSGVSFDGAADGFGFAGGLASSLEAAGTVVPEVELPEGALPVSAAWLSGVGAGPSGVGSAPAPFAA